MAKNKTIHSVANGKAHQIEFPSAEISEFTKFDAGSGSIKWKVSLSKGMATLFDHMGWSMPGDATTQEGFETKLKGGNFILTAKDKLTEMEIDVAFAEIKGFTCHRFELKGKKKKGYRRELRFSMSFTEQGAAGKLESYMETVGSEGSLRVRHHPEEVQAELDLSSDEARQAVLSDE